MPIPYMGSKRKLAAKILDVIQQQNPNMKYFFDLFGGGAAVAEEATKRGLVTHYNELNKGVAALVQKLIEEGITPNCYDWVSKEDFELLKNGDDWYCGLVKTCWSFGNGQKSYLYSSTKEEQKRWVHFIIQNRDEPSLRRFNEFFGTDLQLEDIHGDTFQERRLSVQRLLTAHVQDCRLEHGECLEGVSRLSSFCKVDNTVTCVIEHGECLEGVSRLSSFFKVDNTVTCVIEHGERLEGVSRLSAFCQVDDHVRNVIQHGPRLEGLSVQAFTASNLSYEQVDITTPIAETVVYCDPPYQGAAEYQRGGFDHEAFFDWCRSSPYKIYISEYNAPFPLVIEWTKRSILSATNKSKVVTEKLYTNR